MNSNQIGSLVNSVLKILGTALAAHGYATASSLLGLPVFAQELTGIIVTLVGLYFSHIQNSAAAPADSTSSRTPPGTLPVLLLVGTLGASLFLSGCASAPTNIYKAVGTTDATVTAAVRAWDIYVMNNPVPISQQIAVKNAFLKVQAAEKLVLDGDAVYAAYGTTNAPAGVLATLSADQAAFTDALTDLTALLSQFKIKL